MDFLASGGGRERQAPPTSLGSGLCPRLQLLGFSPLERTSEAPETWGRGTGRGCFPGLLPSPWLFFFFWLPLGLDARRLSLVAVSRGWFSLGCKGFSLRWLLLFRFLGSRATSQ